MGKPLNLYQETGWGVPPSIDDLTVGPRSWHDLMTGYYVPSNVRAGQSVGFLWINGERPTTFEVVFDGELNQVNADKTSLSLCVSGGKMIPLSKDAGTLQCLVSGAIAENKVGTTTLQHVWSGGLSGIKMDGSAFSCAITNGMVTGGLRDNATCFIQPQGMLTGLLRTTSSLSVVFEGSFVGMHKDNLDTITLDFYDMTYYTETVIRRTAEGADELPSVDFEFYALEYKTALGGG